MARLSKALRFEILARDGFKCRYCGRAAPQVALHVDHVLPRSAGGIDKASNLAASCADCNHGKSDRVLIKARTGYDLSPDKRPARMAKMRLAREVKQVGEHHELDTAEIDDLDEIDEDDQLCLIWCMRHTKFEWHSIDRDLIGSGAVITRKRAEVKW